VRRPGRTGSFWPTDQQELLLAAALLPADRAVPAWLAARETLDIDVLERGSYSLLPLVYRRLSESLPDEPLLPRLKGIYRHTWSKNQVLLDDLRATVAALSGAGIQPVVVGGAARLAYYPELGLRTLTEFELLVRGTEVEPALRAVGWSGEGVPPGVLRGRSALRVTAGRRPFGLHWRLLPEYPGGDDAYETRPLEHVEAQALAPAEELLHTLLGGARTALWANVQWAADAALVARSGEVDWERLASLAEERRGALRLREALGYLAEAFHLPVPAGMLERLGRIPATRRDRLAHRLGGTGGGALGELPRTLATYVRSTEGRRPLRSLLGLPGFLRVAWNVDRAWQLPVVAARKGAATLAAKAQRRH
jgi:hypothetical protein